MANWIAAVRRCSVSKPGRHTQPNSDVLARARQQQERGEEVVPATVTTVLRPPSATDSREEVLLRTFVEANDSCAECNAQPVTYVKLISLLHFASCDIWLDVVWKDVVLYLLCGMSCDVTSIILYNVYAYYLSFYLSVVTDCRWISTSLGITLCQSCSTVHMQLSWAISKLKNIELDEFSEWQLNLLHQELGNARVNSIWEVDVPAGWDKPQQVRKGAREGRRMGG